jgi:magnesium transporter
MGAKRRATVVESMSAQARKAVKPLLRYSEGTAGALMDPAVPSVLETASVGETLGQLRKNPQHALYYVYVVDEDQKLVGVVNMRELLEARPEEVVGLKAVRVVDSLSVRAGSEAVIAHPAWKRFHALPVVEADGRLLGVIRYKSVRELEDRFVETGLRDHGAETAAAIGELYGLGFRALFEWGATALLGPTEQRRRGR